MTHTTRDLVDAILNNSDEVDGILESVLNGISEAVDMNMYKDKNNFKKLLDPVMKRYGVKYTIKKSNPGFSAASWDVNIISSPFNWALEVSPLVSLHGNTLYKTAKNKSSPTAQKFLLALDREVNGKQVLRGKNADYGDFYNFTWELVRSPKYKHIPK